MERLPNETDSKWDELANGPQPESYGDEQDIVNVQAMRQIAKSFFEKRQAMAPEQAKKDAQFAAGIQKDFLEQRKRDKERGRETSKEEFLKWEQDYTQMWDRMLDNVHSVNMDMDTEAKTEEPIFFSDDDKRIPETIEVQAGQYYMERNRELRDAIMASDSETKEKDLRTLGSFLRLVIEHVSFRYATPEETRFKYTDGEQGFENDRSRAHNEVIKCLNALNDLAKKYGTTRFTPRNFWTSETKGQTKDIARRMKYDRKVVIEYYTLAFGKGLDEEVKRRRAEEARYY